MLACLRVSAGDWLWGRVRGGHAGVSRRSVRRRGVGGWGRACVCVLACLRVSAGDRLCGCVCEARRAGECVKEMLRVRESVCVCERAGACVREQVHV